MRLVHIISSLERGGAQAVLFQIVQSLQERGYEQSIIYFHDGPYVKQFIDAGIPVYQVKGFVASFDPLAWYQLQGLLKRLQPSCVHTVLWAANWIGRLVTKWLAIPCIASLHNNYDQNGWQRHLLDRLAPGTNAAIIAVSAEVHQSFVRYHPVAGPISIIRNGIDTHKKAVPIDRTSLGFLPEHFVIGSVGRFVPIKRYPLLLEIVACLQFQYPQVRLLLIGTGPEEANLRAYAEQLGITSLIHWIIDMPASPYFAAMDCFILTSPKEGISMALLEAMQNGVACCVTAPSLQHSVVQHMHNGIVANTDNATLITRNLELLITNDALRSKLAQNAQQAIAQEFSSDQMVAAYDHVFQKYAKK